MMDMQRLTDEEKRELLDSGIISHEPVSEITTGSEVRMEVRVVVDWDKLARFLVGVAARRGRDVSFEQVRAAIDADSATKH